MKSNELKAEMARQGVTSEEMAKNLNISRSSFSRKMNGSAEFKISEAVKISTILKLNKTHQQMIFLDSEAS